MSHYRFKYDLFSSALRVYLTCRLQETEDVAQLCRTEKSACFALGDSTGARYLWEIALIAAEKASVSIKDCQQALSLDVGALSVMETLQDSLLEALHRARKGDENDKYSHGKLSRAYRTRANYLSQGNMANKRNDRELSSFWNEAAQNVQLKIELNLEVDDHESQIATYLHEADKLEKNKEAETNVRQINLYDAAYHHYNYAAALCAADRPNAHNFAAELYGEAIQHLEKAQKASDLMKSSASAEGILWERAAASCEVAAEMVATHAGNTTCRILRNDPMIQSVVAAAQNSAADAGSVVQMFSLVEKVKAAATATKAICSSCRDASMLSMWHTLASQQEDAALQVEHCIQRFLDGDIKAVDALTATAEIVRHSERSAERVRELQTCKERIVYFQKRAAQALLGVRPFMLAHKCWIQAALHLETAAEVCMSTDNSDAEHDRMRQFRYKAANDCVNIVENVLSTAVEYLDKARGAEAGERVGRDPREAQMWRKAAECLVQKAELQLSEAEARNNESAKPLEAARESADVQKVNERVQLFSETAKYFQLAFKHRTLPDADARQNGTRVANLYERAAELMIIKDVENGALARKAINLHDLLIGQLNKPEIMPPEVIVLREMVCEFAALECSTVDPCLRQYWNKACEYLSHALTKDPSSERYATGSAAAILYALAARATRGLERRYYAAAARALAAAFLAGRNLNKLALYNTVIAERVLRLSKVPLLLPPKVTDFFAQVRRQCAAEDALVVMAEEHVKYLEKRIHYKCQRMHKATLDSAREVLQALQSAIDLLLSLFHYRAEETYEQRLRHDWTSNISYQVLVVRCHEGLATAAPGSVKATAWKEALRRSQKLDPSTKSATSKAKEDQLYKKAVVAMESIVQAAEAQIEGDTQQVSDVASALSVPAPAPAPAAVSSRRLRSGKLDS